MNAHIVSGMRISGWGWVRMGTNGPGLGWKDTRKHPLMFSERNGYKRGMQVGWLRINYLESLWGMEWKRIRWWWLSRRCSLRVVRLQEQDVLLFETSGNIRPEEIVRLRELVRSEFGGDVRALVLSGVSLRAVLRSWMVGE